MESITLIYNAISTNQNIMNSLDPINNKVTRYLLIKNDIQTAYSLSFIVSVEILNNI